LAQGKFGSLPKFLCTFSSPGFVVGKLAPNNFNFPNLEHQIYGKQYQMETFQSFAVLLSLKILALHCMFLFHFPIRFPDVEIL